MWNMNGNEDVHGVMTFRIATILGPSLSIGICIIYINGPLVHFHANLSASSCGQQMQSKPTVMFPLMILWYTDTDTCIILYYIQHSSSKVSCVSGLSIWSPTPTMQLSNAPAHGQRPNIFSAVSSSEKASVLPRAKNPWHDALKFLSTHLHTPFHGKVLIAATTAALFSCFLSTSNHRAVSIATDHNRRTRPVPLTIYLEPHLSISSKESA